MLSIDHLESQDFWALYQTATALKQNPQAYANALSGKSFVMLFEKPSLRTRVSFEIGLTKLGAHVMYFDHSAQKIGVRESVKDYAKNLERFADGLIARTFSHDVLVEMGEHADIPVVNALSDLVNLLLRIVNNRLGALSNAWLVRFVLSKCTRCQAGESN